MWEIESESERGELFLSGNSDVEALVNYVAFFSRVAFIDNYFLITLSLYIDLFILILRLRFNLYKLL